ncbi:hypothetical protein GT037_011173 [Alternaria burnsii]|uniref:Uncharacterized protein n=1 Tax=Alternaria burnsii TaxID=1187904 RepID=A0A8H7B0N5_9PLEO|nr:uncharacterized protein GT037_011173 [Alternaria burnsii]KAF7670722.1 hypothetical protein GT037_011173 [Alternaria burnsii]
MEAQLIHCRPPTLEQTHRSHLRISDEHSTADSCRQDSQTHQLLAEGLQRHNEHAN